MRAWICFLLALVAMPAIAATPPAPKLPRAPASAVQGQFVLPARPVWAGEVFDLGLDWQVDWGLFRNFEGDLAWKPDPIVAEPWSKPALNHPAPVGGKDRATLHLATRAMAITPGRVTLSRAGQAMAIVTGGYIIDGVSISTTGIVQAESAASALVVRPLPPPPLDFSGAVGQFELRSRIDRRHVAAGDPIRWTLTLAGSGNWTGFAGLPSRPLDRAFDVVGKPKVYEGKTPALFDRTLSETVTIVPRQSGHFILGPVDMNVFDPARGRYVVVSAPAIDVEVRPGPGPRPPRSEAEPPSAGDDDPLPPLLAGEGRARTPLEAKLVHLLIVLPFVAMAALWLLLSLRHALGADPDRQARIARRRLTRTLHALDGTADEAERRRLIKAWQRDTGFEWKLGHAAPVPASFEAGDWRRAWMEADVYLYGPSGTLPGDWLDRARALHEAKPPPPPFRPSAVLERRHLYPLAMILCVLLAANAAPLPAAPGASSLEQAVAQNPLDWVARYNLARRAAIARRWEEAAGQAGIAWVQRPRNPATRALWDRTAREAAIAGAADGGLPRRDGYAGQLAALGAPVEWQLAAIVAALGLAGGGAILLLVRFGGVRRGARPVGLAVLVAGAATAAASAIALNCYGSAALPGAALAWHETLLRPVPIHTSDAEATARLAPGIVVVPDARFLGWVHIAVRGGPAGWLRSEQLHPVWR